VCSADVRNCNAEILKGTPLIHYDSEPKIGKQQGFVGCKNETELRRSSFIDVTHSYCDVFSQILESMG
jgi:hypothetical protein